MTAETLSFESREKSGFLKKLLTKPIDLHEHQQLVTQRLERLKEALKSDFIDVPIEQLDPSGVRVFR